MSDEPEPTMIGEVVSATIYDDATSEVIYDSDEVSGENGTMTVHITSDGIFKLDLDETP